MSGLEIPAKLGGTTEIPSLRGWDFYILEEVWKKRIGFK